MLKQVLIKILASLYPQTLQKCLQKLKNSCTETKASRFKREALMLKA
jgi:hypothetical protein